jgi:hypothetical protein
LRLLACLLQPSLCQAPTDCRTLVTGHACGPVGGLSILPMCGQVSRPAAPLAPSRATRRSIGLRMTRACVRWPIASNSGAPTGPARAKRGRSRTRPSPSRSRCRSAHRTEPGTGSPRSPSSARRAGERCGASHAWLLPPMCSSPHLLGVAALIHTIWLHVSHQCHPAVSEQIPADVHAACPDLTCLAGALWRHRMPYSRGVSHRMRAWTT